MADLPRTLVELDGDQVDAIATAAAELRDFANLDELADAQPPEADPAAKRKLAAELDEIAEAWRRTGAGSVAAAHPASQTAAAIVADAVGGSDGDRVFVTGFMTASIEEGLGRLAAFRIGQAAAAGALDDGGLPRQPAREPDHDDQKETGGRGET